MVYKKISSISEVSDFLTERLSTELAAGRWVVWLVPGGSSIAVALDVAARLKDGDLSNLTVTLTDERYGDLNHSDSNWWQLQQGGFDLPGATLHPVLTGDNRQTTTQKFAGHLQRLLHDADYKLGFFGIGADGHTAGILPGSPAVNELDFAASYDAGNFERITMTPSAIKMLDEAVVYAAGEVKWPVLEQLETTKELNDQPAQILKHVPRLTIFNDYKGDV